MILADEGPYIVADESAGQEVADAERSARQLGIDFHVFDWRHEFSELVQSPFVRGYQAGETPNPCVICNKTVKFGLFLQQALALGFRTRRNHREVHEDPRQVEQAGEPAGDENDVEGLDPKHGREFTDGLGRAGCAGATHTYSHRGGRREMK